MQPLPSGDTRALEMLAKDLGADSRPDERADDDSRDDGDEHAPAEIRHHLVDEGVALARAVRLEIGLAQNPHGKHRPDHPQREHAVRRDRALHALVPSGAQDEVGDEPARDAEAQTDRAVPHEERDESQKRAHDGDHPEGADLRVEEHLRDARNEGERQREQERHDRDEPRHSAGEEDDEVDDGEDGAGDEVPHPDSALLVDLALLGARSLGLAHVSILSRGPASTGRPSHVVSSGLAPRFPF